MLSINIYKTHKEDKDAKGVPHEMEYNKTEEDSWNVRTCKSLKQWSQASCCFWKDSNHLLAWYLAVGSWLRNRVSSATINSDMVSNRYNDVHLFFAIERRSVLSYQ